MLDATTNNQIAIEACSSPPTVPVLEQMKLHVDRRLCTIPRVLNWRSCLESHSLWCELLIRIYYYLHQFFSAIHIQTTMLALSPVAAALWYALRLLSQWPLIITESPALMSWRVGVCLCAYFNCLHDKVNTLERKVAILIKGKRCWEAVCVRVRARLCVYTQFASLSTLLCFFVETKRWRLLYECYQTDSSNDTMLPPCN